MTLSEEMEEKAPFHVRERFKSETGLDWGNADEEKKLYIGVWESI